MASSQQHFENSPDLIHLLRVLKSNDLTINSILKLYTPQREINNSTIPIDIFDEEGLTIVHRAVIAKDTQTLRTLIYEYHVSPNIQSSPIRSIDGIMTPLLIACRYQCSVVIQLLLQHPLIVVNTLHLTKNVILNHGRKTHVTPHQYTREEAIIEQQEIQPQPYQPYQLQHLSRYLTGLDPSTYNFVFTTPLLEAITNGDLITIKKLIQMGALVNYNNQFQYPPLPQHLPKSTSNNQLGAQSIPSVGINQFKSPFSLATTTAITSNTTNSLNSTQPINQKDTIWVFTSDFRPIHSTTTSTQPYRSIYPLQQPLFRTILMVYSSLDLKLDIIETLYRAYCNPNIFWYHPTGTPLTSFSLALVTGQTILAQLLLTMNIKPTILLNSYYNQISGFPLNLNSIFQRYFNIGSLNNNTQLTPSILSTDTKIFDTHYILTSNSTSLTPMPHFDQYKIENAPLHKNGDLISFMLLLLKYPTPLSLCLELQDYNLIQHVFQFISSNYDTQTLQRELKLPCVFRIFPYHRSSCHHRSTSQFVVRNYDNLIQQERFVNDYLSRAHLHLASHQPYHGVFGSPSNDGSIYQSPSTVMSFDYCTFDNDFRHFNQIGTITTQQFNTNLLHQLPQQPNQPYFEDPLYMYHIHGLPVLQNQKKSKSHLITKLNYPSTNSIQSTISTTESMDSDNNNSSEIISSPPIYKQYSFDPPQLRSYPPPFKFINKTVSLSSFLTFPWRRHITKHQLIDNDVTSTSHLHPIDSTLYQQPYNPNSTEVSNEQTHRNVYCSLMTPLMLQIELCHFEDVDRLTPKRELFDMNQLVDIMSLDPSIIIGLLEEHGLGDLLHKQAISTNNTNIDHVNGLNNNKKQVSTKGTNKNNQSKSNLSSNKSTTNNKSTQFTSPPITKFNESNNITNSSSVHNSSSLPNNQSTFSFSFSTDLGMDLPPPPPNINTSIVTQPTLPQLDFDDFDLPPPPTTTPHTHTQSSLKSSPTTPYSSSSNIPTTSTLTPTTFMDLSDDDDLPPPGKNSTHPLPPPPTLPSTKPSTKPSQQHKRTKNEVGKALTTSPTHSTTDDSVVDIQSILESLLKAMGFGQELPDPAPIKTLKLLLETYQCDPSHHLEFYNVNPPSTNEITTTSTTTSSIGLIPVHSPPSISQLISFQHPIATNFSFSVTTEFSPFSLALLSQCKLALKLLFQYSNPHQTQLPSTSSSTTTTSTTSTTTTATTINQHKLSSKLPSIVIGCTSIGLALLPTTFTNELSQNKSKIVRFVTKQFVKLFQTKLFLHSTTNSNHIIEQLSKNPNQHQKSNAKHPQSTNNCISPFNDQFNHLSLVDIIIQLIYFNPTKRITHLMMAAHYDDLFLFKYFLQLYSILSTLISEAKTIIHQHQLGSATFNTMSPTAKTTTTNNGNNKSINTTKSYGKQATLNQMLHMSHDKPTSNYNYSQDEINQLQHNIELLTKTGLFQTNDDLMSFSDYKGRDVYFYTIRSNSVNVLDHILLMKRKNVLDELELESGGNNKNNNDNGKVSFNNHFFNFKRYLESNSQLYNDFFASNHFNNPNTTNIKFIIHPMPLIEQFKIIKLCTVLNKIDRFYSILLKHGVSMLGFSYYYQSQSVIIPDQLFTPAAIDQSSSNTHNNDQKQSNDTQFILTNTQVTQYQSNPIPIQSFLLNNNDSQSTNNHLLNPWNSIIVHPRSSMLNTDTFRNNFPHSQCLTCFCSKYGSPSLHYSHLKFPHNPTQSNPTAIYPMMNEYFFSPLLYILKSAVQIQYSTIATTTTNNNNNNNNDINIHNNQFHDDFNDSTSIQLAVILQWICDELHCFSSCDPLDH